MRFDNFSEISHLITPFFTCGEKSVKFEDFQGNNCVFTKAIQKIVLNRCIFMQLF